MKKKVLLLLLCASIVLTSACGGNNKPKDTTTQSKAPADSAAASSSVTTTAFVDPNATTTTTAYTIENQEWTGSQVTNPTSVSKYNDYVMRVTTNLKQHGINVVKTDTTSTPIISMDTPEDTSVTTEVDPNAPKTYTVDNIAEYIFQSATASDVMYNATVRTTKFHKDEKEKYYSVFEQWWDANILAIEGQFIINDATVLKLMAQYLMDNYKWIPTRHLVALNAIAKGKYTPTQSLSGIYTTLVYEAMNIDPSTSEIDRAKQVFKYLCNLYSVLATNDVIDAAPDTGDWMLSPGYTSTMLGNMMKIKTSEWGLANVSLDKISFGINELNLPTCNWYEEKQLSEKSKKLTKVEYLSTYNTYFFNSKRGTVTGLTSTLNFERSMLERALTAMTLNINLDCETLASFIYANPVSIYSLLIGIDSGAYAGVGAESSETTESNAFVPVQSKYANVIASHGATGNEWTSYTSTLRAAMLSNPMFSDAWNQLCCITPMGYSFGDAVTWICTEQATNHGEYCVKFGNNIYGTFYKPSEADNEKYSWFIQIPIRGSVTESELKNILDVYVALAGVCTDEDYARALEFAISGSVGKIAANLYTLGIDYCDDMAIFTIARG